jgi:hypothetical protein
MFQPLGNINQGRATRRSDISQELYYVCDEFLRASNILPAILSSYRSPFVGLTANPCQCEVISLYLDETPSNNSWFVSHNLRHLYKFHQRRHHLRRLCLSVWLSRRLINRLSPLICTGRYIAIVNLNSCVRCWKLERRWLVWRCGRM